jgi:hypothetical protein
LYRQNVQDGVVWRIEKPWQVPEFIGEEEQSGLKGPAYRLPAEQYRTDGKRRSDRPLQLPGLL